MSDTGQKVVKWIVAIVCLLIIFGGTTVIYGKTQGWYKNFDINEDQEKASKKNTEEFFQKIDECKNSKDYNCRCDIFFNFPASFLPENVLLFQKQQLDTNVMLYYKKPESKIKDIDLKNTEIIFGIVDAIDRNNQKLFFNKDFYDVFNAYKLKQAVVFTQNPYPSLTFFSNENKAEFNNKVDSVFFTSYVIKTKEDNFDQMMFLVLSRELIKPEKATESYLTENGFANFGDAIPVCSQDDSRINALENFNDLVNAFKTNIDKTEIKINLPEGYYINVIYDSITLYDSSGVPVRTIEINIAKNSDMEQLKFKKTAEKERELKAGLAIYYATDNVLCSDNELKLTNGDTAVVKKEEKNCLAKL